MEIDKYKIKGEKYKDGLTAKFDNRRVSVIKKGKEFIIEFMIMNKENEKILFDSKNIHGCQVSAMKLSKEASEIMIIMLAELMDLKVGK